VLQYCADDQYRMELKKVRGGVPCSQRWIFWYLLASESPPGVYHFAMAK
jgi:hypothetical protein